MKEFKIECPHCKKQFDSPESEAIRMARFEDQWMNHCEEMFRKGWRPGKFENLPEFLKTKRIGFYYENLEKRIKIRKEQT
ncbi:hypothetical protein [Leptospira weilii]|uniref:hypothetical protein n=1 Tax=Leptospira weilii TaxID=28184 RepID=UPI00077442EB|nr:hypothetical protein [Leptospira weilii]